MSDSRRNDMFEFDPDLNSEYTEIADHFFGEDFGEDFTNPQEPLPPSPPLPSNKAEYENDPTFQHNVIKTIKIHYRQDGYKIRLLDWVNVSDGSFATEKDNETILFKSYLRKHEYFYLDETKKIIVPGDNYLCSIDKNLDNGRIETVLVWWDEKYNNYREVTKENLIKQQKQPANKKRSREEMQEEKEKPKNKRTKRVTAKDHEIMNATSMEALHDDEQTLPSNKACQEVHKNLLESNNTFTEDSKKIIKINNETMDGNRIHDKDYVSKETGKFFCTQSEFQFKCQRDDFQESKNNYMQFVNFKKKNIFYLKKDLIVDDKGCYRFSKKNEGNDIQPLEAGVMLSSIRVVCKNIPVVRYFLHNETGNYDKVLSKKQIVQKNRYSNLRENKKNIKEPTMIKPISSNKNIYEKDSTFKTNVLRTKNIDYFHNGERINGSDKVNALNGGFCINADEEGAILFRNYLGKHEYRCVDNTAIIIPGDTGLCSVERITHNGSNIVLLWWDEKSNHYREVATINSIRRKKYCKPKTKDTSSDNNTSTTTSTVTILNAIANQPNKKRAREEKKVKTKPRKRRATAHEKNEEAKEKAIATPSTPIVSSSPMWTQPHSVPPPTRPVIFTKIKSSK